MHFRSLFPIHEAVRCALWKRLKISRPITVRMKSGTRFTIRQKPFSDYDVAYELFLFKCYPLPEMEPSLIVDLGGNVGYSCLLWAERYPNAAIIVVEPNPQNAQLLRKNVHMNGWEKRVTVMEAAAGPENGTVSFVDAGTMGHISKEGTLRVPMVDILAVIGDRPIDILKMDIEGGEFAIMSDPRFRALKLNYLVIEWHDGYVENPEQWCTSILEEMGLNVRPTPTQAPSGGLLLATRKSGGTMNTNWLKQIQNGFQIVCPNCKEVLKSDLPTERAAWCWSPLLNEHVCISKV